MNKRYLRIDLEYDMDFNASRLYSYIILENINRILREDMPYVKVLFTRDTSDRDKLSEPVYRGKE